MDPAALEELLEQGERTARAKDEAKKQEQRRLSDPDNKSNVTAGARTHNSKHGFPGRKPNGAHNRYSEEREENDERRSRRSHDSAEDEDMKDGSDKGSANGSARRRSSRRGSSGSGRSRHSSRDKNRGGDFYRGPARAPLSRHDDDRYRPGSGPQDRRRDRSPRRRDERERSPRRRDDRDPRSSYRRRSRDGPRRAATPEPTDDERDRRTVFVQQLAARLRSRELKDFFQQVGEVVEAQIVKDRVSNRSKGVGYVEFKHEESVQKAIGLTGQKLLAIPIIVQLTEAEKNRQARNTDSNATQANGVPYHRLYVGNIHFSLTEEDVRGLFDSFGELEFVQLQKDEQGRSKGYGFVQYSTDEAAKDAMEAMNGFEVGGRPMRVGLGSERYSNDSSQSLQQRFGGSQAHQAAAQGSSAYGSGGRGAHAGGNSNFDRASGRDVDKATGASALDDTDVAGVNFNNISRDSLMRKLARVDAPEQKTAAKSQLKNKAPIEEVAPSRCVLLKHMYNQAEETDPNWQAELRDDVRTECEDKYGHVVHIGLALDNDDGEIYIKFDRVQGGQNAYRGLSGRYFGGRQITAQYVVDAVYRMVFPEASNL